jgi:hypothetical protein
MLTLDTLPPATRTIPRAVLAVAALALVPTVVTRVRGGANFSGALLAASLIAGAGLGYAIDDAAARTFASSPTPLLVRRGVRAALCVVALAAAWIAALLVASTSTGTVPSPGELAPCAFAAAAIAVAFATRVEPDLAVSPGFVAALATLLSMVVVDALALRVDALPSLQGNDRAAWWWIGAVAVLSALRGSRDPASRGFIRRRR